MRLSGWGVVGGREGGCLARDMAKALGEGSEVSGLVLDRLLRWFLVRCRSTPRWFTQVYLSG